MTNEIPPPQHCCISIQLCSVYANTWRSHPSLYLLMHRMCMLWFNTSLDLLSPSVMNEVHISLYIQSHHIYDHKISNNYYMTAQFA